MWNVSWKSLIKSSMGKKAKAAWLLGPLALFACGTEFKDLVVGILSLNRPAEYVKLNPSAAISGAVDASVGGTGSGAGYTDISTAATGTGASATGSGVAAIGVGTSSPTDLSVDGAVTVRFLASQEINLCSHPLLSLTCGTSSFSFQSSSLAGLSGAPTVMLNELTPLAVPAAYYEVTQVTDVISGGSDYPGNLTEYDGLIYFGTYAVGTTRVKLHRLNADGSVTQISNVRSTGSDGVSSVIAWNGEYYFTSYDPTGDFKLYKTDGTGTINQVSDLKPTLPDDISSLMEFNGSLYFRGASYLMRMDTAGNINQLSTISLAPQIEFNNELYLTGGSPSKLYKIDTADVITQVSDIRSGSSDSVSGLTVWRNSLFFIANNASGFSKLHRLDADGTISQVSDIRSGASDSISGVTLLNDALYFRANNSSGYAKLFKLGADGVIRQITDFVSGGSDFSGFGSYIMAYSNELYFQAYNASGKTKMFKVNSSGEVTQLFDLQGAANDDNPRPALVSNGAMYFWAYASGTNSKLFKLVKRY